jgi:hypothetical protein
VVASALTVQLVPHSAAVGAALTFKSHSNESFALRTPFYDSVAIQVRPSPI